MESLTEAEFGRWAAIDEVIPLEHPSVMLGLIAYMLGTWLDLRFEGDTELIDICMPWAKRSDQEKIQAGFKQMKQQIQQRTL